MKISEMITDRYKLRIPPTVYYDLLADVQEAEEEQEPTTKNDLGVETTTMIDKSNFSQEQYKTDLQSAYDCGYERAKNDLAVDCISRQAVIDLMMQKWGENFSGDDAMQESIDAIRVMSSATPQEPRKGHWIDREVYDADRWKCSECGRTEPYKENYCPNCGADMRGEEV